MKPSVNFHFGQDNKVSVKGFDAVDIKKPVTVTVKGNVQSISHDEWGKSFSLGIDSCTIESRNQDKNIKDIVEGN